MCTCRVHIHIKAGRNLLKDLFLKHNYIVKNLKSSCIFSGPIEHAIQADLICEATFSLFGIVARILSEIEKKWFYAKFCVIIASVEKFCSQQCRFL